MEQIKIWNQIPQNYCIFYVYINWKYCMENIYRYYAGKKRERQKRREGAGLSQEPEKPGTNRPNNFNQNLCSLVFDPSEKTLF